MVNIFISFFIAALLIFSRSIALFIFELQLSVKALNKYLEDLEETCYSTNMNNIILIKK